jgi:hypothetical protein
MFKLIFRTITLFVIIIILTVVLAVWEGGKPFRWIGGKIEIVGKVIERFGDRIDEIKKGGKKVGKELIELKGTFDSIQDNEQKPSERRDGTINKN